MQIMHLAHASRDANDVAKATIGNGIASCEIADTPPKLTDDRAFLFACVLLLAVAGFLRIYHIAQRSLWFDEAVAANISHGKLGETLTLIRLEDTAPIVHPLILYAVEKVTSGPFAVRCPSFMASLLAVFMMLYFVRIPSIDHKTAALSALMLSVSAAQIRYAQEVREYSLSVLFAAVLLYLFMRVASSSGEGYSRIVLYLVLFSAPLIQYGLALFSLGILGALLVQALASGSLRTRLRQIIAACVSLLAGSLVSFVLTLGYQWGQRPSYLQEQYFEPGSSLPRFALSHTHYLLTLLLPGSGAALISGIAIFCYLVKSLRSRSVQPLLVLTLISFGTVFLCALLRLYPYGGTRQCLFLAPALCLLASATLVHFANSLQRRLKRPLFVAIVCIVVASGILQIRSVRPYAEIEDVQRILGELQNQIRSGDEVYVYGGAVPAIDFYARRFDERFVYGDFHRQAPVNHVSEILGGLLPGTNRIWILFSHVYQDEDQRTVRDLPSDWTVKPVCLARGSALYLATRGSTSVREVPDTDVNHGDAGPAHTAVAVRDTFWEWSIRNHADRINKAP
jgi:hypothetical protein